MFKLNKNGKCGKRCRRCFAYVRYSSRKCKYCGFVFKSAGKYIFDTIKRAFNIQEVHLLNKAHRSFKEKIFFTAREVESLFDQRNYRILTFLVLNDANLLDETALIELGEMISSIENANLR